MSDEHPAADRLMTPDRLRRGDVLLLEPGPVSRLVSRVVTQLDGSEYSHALILDTTAPHFYTLSADPESAEHASGVNAIALRLFNGDAVNPRAVRVLRPRRGGERAADVARRFVELSIPEDFERYPIPDPDPSDFGWQHIVISSVAALARHLEEGFWRDRLWDLAHGLSRRLLPDEPCTAAVVKPPAARLAWDCCHFVDHSFCTAGFPLGMIESDPIPRGHLEPLLTCLRDLLREAERHLPIIGDDDDGDGDTRERRRNVETDDALDALAAETHPDLGERPSETLRRVGDEHAGLLQVANRVTASFGTTVSGAIESGRRADASVPGGLVWPPFVSPRLFLGCEAFEDLGTIPRGALAAG